SGRRDKRRRRKLVCGVTVRANYVALPFAAGRGADEGGESRPDQGSSCSPVRPRKYGPLAQNRRNGAPQGDAPPETIASHAMPEAKRYKVRLAALHAPRIEGANEAGLARALRGTTKSSPRAWRENDHARLSLARMGQAPHAHAV
ncbi:MAG: hypothetical protein IJ935_22295, partial [Afipia sp.]|nr:hypothetical protein [Afipia sp.]